MTNLTPVAQKFVLHWGEMGTRWGLNRTIAQIHALLFLSEKPLPADEIAQTLGIALPEPVNNDCAVPLCQDGRSDSTANALQVL